MNKPKKKRWIKVVMVGVTGTVVFGALTFGALVLVGIGEC
jgi:hypothetical protein